MVVVIHRILSTGNVARHELELLPLAEMSYANPFELKASAMVAKEKAEFCVLRSYAQRMVVLAVPN